jgi:hypothetical protein
MAVSARLWFHFCTDVGWFPAALNLFLPTAIEEQSSRGQLKLRSMKTKHRPVSPLRQRPAVSAT